MNAEPGRSIFVIRHGEKPDEPPPYGVDVDGNQNDHSLLPRGWQRAGALATLFAPFGDQPRSGLATPAQLISPQYDHHGASHRTHETIYPLSQLIAVDIDSPYAEGEESTLGEVLAAATTGVTLVCWEHHAIPTIANSILPIAAGTQIPQDWPGDRFDVVWSFAYDADGSEYVFSQIPQMLLDGDGDSPISP